MARGDIVGLIITPKLPNPSKTQPIDWANFEIRVGTYNEKGRESFFVTTPIFRRVLERNPELRGKITGNIGFRILFWQKRILATHVHPFENTPQLIRKGLGSLIELQIERFFQKTFAGYSITHGPSPGKMRITQLDRRGRGIGVVIPIEKGKELTRKQVIQNFRENKTKTIAARRVELRRQRKRAA